MDIFGGGAGVGGHISAYLSYHPSASMNDRRKKTFSPAPTRKVLTLTDPAWATGDPWTNWVGKRVVGRGQAPLEPFGWSRGGGYYSRNKSREGRVLGRPRP